MTDLQSVTLLEKDTRRREATYNIEAQEWPKETVHIHSILRPDLEDYKQP